MSGNYIKICRSLLDWEWYENTNTKAVFIHCLLKANWKEGDFEGQTIERGSFVTSIAKMSEELNLSPKQIRVALEHLKNTGEVAIKTTNKFTVITVKNYAQYQDEGNQMANKGQTKGKQRANKGQTKGNNRRREEEQEGEEGKKENNIGRFTPPTANEVREYCINGGYNIDPDAFIDFYESKGWMVGKNKMKDWRAAVRNWARSDNKKKSDERQTANIIDEWRNAL